MAQNRPGYAEVVPSQRPGVLARQIRPRTINIIFQGVQPDGTSYVHLAGGLVENDGGGFLGGELKGSRELIYDLVSRLRDAWTNDFVFFCNNQKNKEEQFPFSNCDLSAYRNTPNWDSAMRKLARVGYDIFSAIFLTGDPGLVAAGKQLSRLLRSGEQVVSIQSDDLFIPWHMLYVPPAGQDMLDVDCPWDFEGFIGYQHHIEHTFRKRPQDFRHRIEVSGGIRAGLNVDSRIGKPRVLQPLRELLDKVQDGRIKVRWRESRADLGRALSDSGFDDQFMYFNCHGTVTAAGQRAAHIALTDGEAIYTTDFAKWLTNREFEHSPVILVNACEGGQLSSIYLESFGHVLLNAGANCLIGPQIEMPHDFGKQYAVEFFRELLRGESIGDVVRGLARGFIQRHSNPLGLVMSLYRGLDTYFDVPQRDDPDPTAQRILLVSEDPVERRGAPA
jgi:hypothetical protein